MKTQITLFIAASCLSLFSQAASAQLATDDPQYANSVVVEGAALKADVGLSGAVGNTTASTKADSDGATTCPCHVTDGNFANHKSANGGTSVSAEIDGLTNSNKPTVQ